MNTRRSFLHQAILFAVAGQIGVAQQRRVRTIAGVGKAGYAPEIDDAIRTPVTNPYGTVIGPDGGLYFCEVDTGLTRRLDLRTAKLATIAGNGLKGYAGDGGPASAASFTMPHEIRFDAAGNLFVVERDTHVVRRVDARTRRVSTVAGTGVAGFLGDGGPAVEAQLNRPHSIAFDPAGNLLICDIGNHRIRMVDTTTGVISTFAGTGEARPTPDDASISGTPLNGPRSIDIDASGNVYLVLREGNAVFRIEARTRRLNRVAGTGSAGYSGDGATALQATFNGPKGIAYGSDKSLYVVDTENHAIRRIDLSTGIITTILGTGRRGDGPDGDPLRCQLARPHGVFVAASGIYVTDSENHRIRVIE